MFLKGFHFLFDFSRIVFSFIVFLVTRFVCCFSKSYMEHYNIKKFFLLMLIFFLSIVFLVHGNNFFTFFIGWDGLGITSICLIIFYPNKITLYNSFLTIFFNRLGDVIFIYLICSIFLSFHSFIRLLSISSWWFFLSIILCSFTKSAQFPLSRWLPAAISAPTPISAIVHSSTLVTAGIFLVHKFYYYFENNGVVYLLFFVSFMTFFLGGLIANFELDFKKVVAFSTISQIRIIIFFSSLGLIWVSLTHTIFHAFFKTLLFCVSGIAFLYSFRDQVKRHLSSSRLSNISRLLFFSSCFRIRGLIFSSSFFTKDLLVEILESSFKSFYFFLFLLRGILTMLYLCRIIDCVKSGSFLFTNFSFKEYYRKFWIAFCLFSLIRGMLFSCFCLSSVMVVLSSMELMIIEFLFVTPLLFLVLKSFRIILTLTLLISFIKTFTFSFLGKYLSVTFINQVYFSDLFFAKKVYLYPYKINHAIKFNSRYFIILIIVIIFIINFIYSLSLSEYGIEAAKEIEYF